MAQVEENMRSKCPTCHAERGEPCTTMSGRIAEKVHYGRPFWSSQVKTPFQPYFNWKPWPVEWGKPTIGELYEWYLVREHKWQILG